MTKPRRTRLRVESLEGRDTPSAVTEAWPDDSFAQYQPLNNDTTYIVTGRVAALSDVDYCAFYAEAGTALRATDRAEVVTGNVHTERVPLAVRGATIGDPDYINHVLGQEDY